MYERHFKQQFLNKYPVFRLKCEKNENNIRNASDTPGCFKEL